MDAIFIATNAPGRSAFNKVERRMAPLSRELSGVVLPHDYYGSHLNNAGISVDEDLERKNFKFAADCLAEIWSKTTIDNFPVVAEYIDPDKSELIDVAIWKKDENWFKDHVRSSQYFLQVSKCQDVNCCSKPRSSLFKIIPDGFLPPPLPIQQSDYGLKISLLIDETLRFPSLFVALSMKLGDMMPPSSRAF